MSKNRCLVTSKDAKYDNFVKVMMTMSDKNHWVVCVMSVIKLVLRQICLLGSLYYVYDIHMEKMNHKKVTTNQTKLSKGVVYE